MDIQNNDGTQPNQLLLNKASIGRRLVAFLIDHCIFSLVFGFVFGFVLVIGFTLFDMHDSDGTLMGLLIISFLGFLNIYSKKRCNY